MENDRVGIKDEKLKYKKLIIAVSLLVPVLVAILFRVKVDVSYSFDFLPKIYATINGVTTIFLILAYVAIRSKKISLHRKLMKASIFLSLLFLLMYVTYHMTSDPTPYGGEGFLRPLYFFILITHIALSIGIIPLVLISYVRAISKHFSNHKKIARITLPIWLYITTTGVIVYLMISPYYN